MSPKYPLSGIPAGRERRVRPDLRVDLLSMIRLLLDHLTPSLCETVFQKFRSTERERKWTFYAVSLFWTAMVIRHPPAIQNGLDQTRKGRGRDKLWPKVMATPRAFFKKCQSLRPDLFAALYKAFTARILPKAPPVYASWLAGLRRHFPEIHVVDGSRLSAICHRLGLLRKERDIILPGCLTVFYDLFRGITRQVLFYPDAAAPELPRARSALAWVSKGALLLGDRLYASIQYFHLLARLGLYGLFRRNDWLKIKPQRVLSRRQGGRALLEDSLVRAGCGVNQPPVLLRLIRYRGPGRRLDLLTNVLDPQKLSAEQAVSLYGLRWSIERMFFDLKEVLGLQTLYASHPHLVAQQVYATALVHTAFRVAQARIARKAKVLPEQLSPAKLFPRLAQAANDYCVARLFVMKTRALNPGVPIKFPAWNTLPTAYASLVSLLVQHRRSPRRSRHRTSIPQWKSFAHIRGGPALIKSATVG